MGSNKRTTEDWQALLNKQRASGQTQRAWCMANGVNLFTFQDRASRLRRLDSEPEPSAVKRIGSEPVGWMEVTPEQLVGQCASGGIGIERGGFTVTVTAGFDAEMLAEVLRAVSRVCC